ncbi:MAG: hypothetical protein C5B51_30910, partial [Terriglobia bacterium]
MMGSNILAWSLQIVGVIAAAALAAAALRLRTPGARLLFWQIALLACLTLPLMRPWKRAVIAGDVSVSAVTFVKHSETPAPRVLPLEEALLWLLAAGVVVRSGWLAGGFRKLRLYRRNSRWMGFREGAALLLSEGITSPVTFGVLRPVVLLPAGFPEFEPRVQEAILCHELLHVRRRDWLFMMGEELVRTVFWFHPAIWWLLGEIGLAREQEVDRQVVERTRSREQYVDALLAIAGAGAPLDLAPAPLFLRKRHLKQRVVSILKEVRMSKTRLVSSLAAALVVVVAACWMVTAAFPLTAAPETVTDAPGVSVDLGGATLMHRSGVNYPSAARDRSVQGTVIVQVKLDASGSVADAQVLVGPEELRKPALQSILSWHFAKDAAGTVRQVSINFQGPVATPAPAAAEAAPSSAPARREGGRVLRSITVLGLSETARTELLRGLPVHEGGTIEPGAGAMLTRTVEKFDTHLVAVVTAMPGGGAALTIRPVDAATPPAMPSLDTTPQRLRIGGNVQATKLISQPRPVYPVEAKQAHVQGIVKLLATIAKDGTMQDLQVISGDPLLVPSAMEAVRQWVYQPTLLNGE